MSLPEPSDKNGEDPIQATEQERSAAFEWLRDVALSLQHDIPIAFDGPDHARHAAVALQAWKLSADAAKAAESEKAMSKIVEASAPQIEEAARNMAKAAVIGVGVGPLPSALSAGASTTPITDAAYAEACKPYIGQWTSLSPTEAKGWELARQLERELAEAHAALSVAADAGQVAMMLLQNDRDGAMQWARDIELEWKTDGSPRLKLRATAMPSATVPNIDAEDANRYRWLRVHTIGGGKKIAVTYNIGHGWETVRELGELDSIIDSAASSERMAK